MGIAEKLNVGIVGAAGRGGSFRVAFEAHETARIHAVCDVREEELDAAAERLGAAEKYADYETMLARSELDAIVIGTPMHFHAPQAIAALSRGIHVLSEVTAGVCVAECRDLVQAATSSKAIYMMAENYTYTRPNVLVKELVRWGLFGDVYYGEGEYLHELKALNEITKWRRKWQTGIDGVTYCTHSLGPLLQWMPGDRVVRVCCAGSGHHYTDPRGDQYENQDSCVMLCQMASGGLVKIRVDMLSERPHATGNFQLQGTKGCYESARAPDGINRVWLADICNKKNEWIDLTDLEEDYLPDMWRNPSEAALKAGHSGSDYFEIMDFIQSINGEIACPIGIHEAMDMTLPGLISQQSIVQGGAWLNVPDSRLWVKE